MMDLKHSISEQKEEVVVSLLCLQGKKTVITGKQIFLFEKEGGKYYFRGNSPFNKSCEGNTYMYYLQSFRSKGAKIKVGIFGRSCLNMDNAKHNAHEWKLEYERRRGTPDGEMIYHRTPEALKD